MTTDMTIFVIDDDQDDVEFLIEAAKELYPKAEFIVAVDGERGLQTLGKMDSLPKVIFVDRNMPRMDGVEFLLRLKGDSIRSRIPVIMHSSNFSDSDLKLFSTYQAYTLKKQINFDRLAQELRILLTKLFEVQ